MADTKRQKILETVKKLIAHADSAGAIGSKDEQIAFQAKIAALMREYRIERHEVEPSVIDAMDFRDYGMTLVDAYPAVPGEAPWQAFVYGIIADAHACQSIVIRDNGKFFVAGQTVDRAVVCALSHMLVTSMERLCSEAYAAALFHDPAVYTGYVGEAAYAESYRSGFLQALYERLKEEEAQVDETALILIGRAVTKTQKYLDRAVSGAKGTIDKEMRIDHGGAAERGYEDGMKADLNANRIGGQAQEKKEIAS